MKVAVNDRVHLSYFQEADKPALVQHLNDRDIYERTLRIPFPYTTADADAPSAFPSRTPPLMPTTGSLSSPGSPSSKVGPFIGPFALPTTL
jgi:hypothetical protein